MTSLITGFIVAIATFPGMVVRQALTQLLCWYYGIPVFKVCYFRPWPPFGFVEYETPKSPWTGLALIFGPAVGNAVLGFLIGCPAILGFFGGDENAFFFLKDLLLIWLGVSVATHAFPNFKDAEAIQRAFAADHLSGTSRWIGGTLSAGAYVAAVGSMVWLDVICSVILVIVIPILSVEILRWSY
jgi:hypothetical protein